MSSRRVLLAAAFVTLALCSACALFKSAKKLSVRIFEAELVLPTYEVDRPDPNPRFYQGRAYQGAQGRVYPYPMLDQLTDNRVEKAYRAVYLENAYIRVCVLPEIGGRVFEAVDKTNGYDFLYRQHVIKPALIGMLGAWISGGIEWNFPHHHRARAFMPMDYVLEENPDGSKTVWLWELDLRHRMQFTVGITLHPDRSYFEATIRPYNATPLVQSFLCWANPSVHVGPDYQVIFPPGTQYAVYHGKNQFATWPVAQDSYRGIDYRGVDLSWWKNHPSPVSFFAWNYLDDFLAGYDHGLDAGVVYVADHQIAPGKKFWEWGPGPQGRMWDLILTEQDGPYIELMAGVYSDNQPDYSWLQPYEAKRASQFWYPIREIGGVKCATLEGAVNLELAGQDSTGRRTAKIGFNTTRAHHRAQVRLKAGEIVLYEEVIRIDPARPYINEVPLPARVDTTDLHLSLLSRSGDVLVAYRTAVRRTEPMPGTVTPPQPPGVIETVEELYLTGLRLEQFHNPSMDPEQYYLEALRRDPGHMRANTALGIRCLLQARFREAEERLRIAVARATANHTKTRDGEALYYLGLALQFQDEVEAARDAFSRATWSQAFCSAASYHLAQIACLQGDHKTALTHLDRSIATNTWNCSALNLKVAVLRRLGRLEAAAVQIEEVLRSSPLNLWAWHERLLVHRARGDGRKAAHARQSLLTRRWPGSAPADGPRPWEEAAAWLEAQSFLEVAGSYIQAGLWSEAIGILSVLTEPEGGEANTYPMCCYYLGYCHDRAGRVGEALDWYRRAAKMPHAYCFPFRLESIEVLHAALRRHPEDARAHYYLGNLLYELQPEAAVREWELARDLEHGQEGGTPTLYRNLALAYTRLEQDLPGAIASMERAIALDSGDPRLFYELDLLYESGGVTPERRHALLEAHHNTILPHNDAFSREVVLLAQLGRYDEAIHYMKAHHFRRWEGVGNIHTMWVDAHLLRGWYHFLARRFTEAVGDYEVAFTHPVNLEVAEPYHGGRACQIHYLIGAAYEAAGNHERAAAHFRESADGKRPEGRGILDYYQGMARRKLGREAAAVRLFQMLINHARGRLQALEAGSPVEFFAKFGSRRSPNELLADAHYQLGLGYRGLYGRADAAAAFRMALTLNPNHLWAKVQLEDMNR